MTAVKRVASPMGALLLLVALYTINSLITASAGEFPSDAVEIAWSFGFNLAVTWWAYTDRRARAYSAPFEFEAFVFFAWPVVLPCYLIQTRGWRGLIGSIAVVAAYLFPEVVFWSAYDLFWVDG